MFLLHSFQPLSSEMHLRDSGSAARMALNCKRTKIKRDIVVSPLPEGGMLNMFSKSVSQSCPFYLKPHPVYDFIMRNHTNKSVSSALEAENARFEAEKGAY